VSCGIVFFFSYCPCRARHGHQELKEGDRIAKLWKGEDSVYAGTIDSISVIDGVRTIRVIYDDSDEQVHKEDDDSFDGEDFEFLKEGEEPSKSMFSPGQFSLSAQQMLLRHMQFILLDKLHTVIATKKNAPQGYISALLKWNAKDHLFYFRNLSPIQFTNDHDFAQSLAPLKKELPWRRFGRRGGNQRIVICSPALIKRTKGGKTKIVFTYSRFDSRDGKWERQYDPPAGNPWDRKERKKGKN